MSHKKKTPLTFHCNPGCLIGTLIMVYYTPLYNWLGCPPLYTTNNQGAPKIKDLPILDPLRPFSQDDGCWTEGTAFQLYATFTEATPRTKSTGSGQESHLYTYLLYIDTYMYTYICISVYLCICVSVYSYMYRCHILLMHCIPIWKIMHHNIHCMVMYDGCIYIGAIL